MSSLIKFVRALAEDLNQRADICAREFAKAAANGDLSVSVSMSVTAIILRQVAAAVAEAAKKTLLA